MAEQTSSTPTLPAAAASLYPTASSQTKILGYYQLLRDVATVRGFIGPREVPRLWDRHILNCATCGTLLPEGAKVADIGSGAGLPGIPLAISRPDLQLILIEPLLKRSTFLSEVKAELALDNVTVVRGRAEDKDVLAAYGGSCDIVTSRAVAPLAKLAGWSLPLLKPGGKIMALKGESVTEEWERDRAEVTKKGGGQAEITQLADQPGISGTWVITIPKKRRR